jgi:hypothetical protein
LNQKLDLYQIVTVFKAQQKEQRARDIFEKVASILEENGKLTIIAKNVKKKGHLYTFPWDLVDELSGEDGKFDFAGYTLWCQDDVALKPFAIGHHWVSNILHHYCLHFKKRM